MRDYDIESDLKQEKFQSIKLVQGDRGNKIKINVYEDGQPVKLTGCSITAKYKRADGEIINDGVIENIHDNSFDAVMDSSITKVAGTLKMLFTIEKDAVKVSAFLLLADVREGIGESSSSGGSAGGGEVTVDLRDYYKKIETYSRKEIDAQFKDIANNFTAEQTDSSFILKYGDKIIATIPINGTVVNYGSIVISCSEILEINEGETLDIEVCLSSKPTNNQSIVVITSNSNITTSVSELTFTPDNYSTNQIITLTAIHDASSFDDKSCLVTFASENVENVNITVTVKNIDVQGLGYVQDGLSLDFDFAEVPSDPTTVYDKVNNLSIHNAGYTADNYTDNGVYLLNGGGANSYKFSSSTVSSFSYQEMPEFNIFLNKLKEGNGLTIEYFGQYLPYELIYVYNNGLEVSGTNAMNGGALTNCSSVGGARLKYLNTSDEIIVTELRQSDKVIKDALEINSYSVDNKADTYIHLVLTADENGKMMWYLNGNQMVNTTTATNFKAWDYDTMFKSNYTMILRAGIDDSIIVGHPSTSFRIYNKALTQEEIRTNLEYEVGRTNFVSSANVTP